MHSQGEIDSQPQTQNKDENKINKKRRIEPESKPGSSLMEHDVLPLVPTAITLDIFSRLPAESVLHCRKVCKTWRTFLHDTEFLQMHQRRRRQLLQLDNDTNGGGVGVDAKVCSGLGLLFLIRLKNEDKGNVQLYYGEYDKQYSYNTLRKINHPPINKPNMHAVVGSCNGLVCLALTDTKYYSNYQLPCIYDPVYIFNPITREYVNLPRFEVSFNIDYMVSGFGYHPSSKQYKVLRIYYRRDQPSIGQVQVYTLGCGSGWRNKVECQYKMRRSQVPSLGGVLANGALHWLDKDGNIVAFDLANEEFRMVTPLPGFIIPDHDDEYKPRFQLKELGGCLCFIHHARGACVDIWSFKKTENDQPWIWNKEFNIEWVGQYVNDYEPFAITSTGEVLLWCNIKILLRYDPKTTTIEMLADHNDLDVNFFKAIPHMNNFVSLKALGEKCRTRRSYMCTDNRIMSSTRSS